MSLHLNDKNFDSEVIKSEIPVLVDFWSQRCPPCRMLAPIIDELSIELEGKVKVTKLNTDENMELAMKYNIEFIPTLMIFKSGKVTDTSVGFKSKQDLLKFIGE